MPLAEPGAEAELFEACGVARAVPPLVTIGMPVYNDERNVGHAIDSLLAQSHADLELLISDNASSDATPQLCREYVRRDPRVRYLRHATNRGQVENFAFALAEARGEYFMWASSDDVWHPEFIATLLGALRTNPNSGGAFGPYVVVDDDDRWICPPIRRDCSHRSALVRLSRFCRYYDDCFFYGLYRREFIRPVRLARWWGPNAIAPYSLTTPPLAGLLAAGDVVWVAGPPLLFKRRKSGFRHPRPYADNPVAWLATFVLLQANIAVRSLGSVYRGSRSLGVTLAALPLLSLRLGYEAIRPVPGVVKWILLQAAIAVLGKARLDRWRGKTAPKLGQ
jgi:hypothetical protein